MEQLEDDMIKGDALPEIRQNPKYSLLFKIIFFSLILVVVVLIIVVILQAIKISNIESDKKDEGKNYDLKFLENDGHVELWNNLYGIKNGNLSYVEEGTISNSFKKGAQNYNAEIGEINGGADYTKNENNKYTLYIPQEAINKGGNDYNELILFIHGEDEKKENIEYY